MGLKRGVCSLGLLVAAVPAQPAQPALAQPALAQPAASRPGAALPTGDDGAFRQRMLDWSGPGPVGYDDPEVFSTVALPLRLPLRQLPRISSRFGMRSDPLGAGTRLHAGVDLPGSAGSPVLAAAAGVVRHAGWRGGYGYMVEIDHGGALATRYGHLSRLMVSDGEPVREGEMVGLMGSTGHSTGNHLHYEVRVAGRAVNPLGGRYAAHAVVASFAPYLPPQVTIEPRWTGWTAARRAPNQLPVAAFP